MTDLRKTIEGMKLAAEKATLGRWLVDEDCSIIAESQPCPDDSAALSAFFGKPVQIGRTLFSANYGDQHLKDCEHIAASNPQAVIALAKFALDAIEVLNKMSNIAIGFKYEGGLVDHPKELISETWAAPARDFLAKHGLAERGEGEL